MRRNRIWRTILSYVQERVNTTTTFNWKRIISRTRKSYCVNARGISSTPYAVLSRGYPIPSPGVYPIPGTPILTWLGGTPSWVPSILTWGYPILGTPHPDLAWGHPILGTPHPIVGHPLYRTGVPHPGRDLGPVAGIPPERTWYQWKYYGMEMGYPPSPDVDRQTPVKTVPSCRTRYAGGKNMLRLSGSVVTQASLTAAAFRFPTASEMSFTLQRPCLVVFTQKGSTVSHEAHHTSKHTFAFVAVD